MTVCYFSVLDFQCLQTLTDIDVIKFMQIKESQYSWNILRVLLPSGIALLLEDLKRTLLNSVHATLLGQRVQSKCFKRRENAFVSVLQNTLSNFNFSVIYPLWDILMLTQLIDDWLKLFYSRIFMVHFEVSPCSYNAMKSPPSKLNVMMCTKPIA